MSFVNGGDEMYYAYKSGASNETGQEIVKLRTPGNVAASPDRTGTTGRINILFSGR